ncbi:MAG: cytochrome c3 family protein, partial [Bacteroidota bacterium]
CHNPHGSNNHLLLQQGTCYLCHDDFRGSYKVVHGPVSVGHCATCHTSHGSGKEKLLVSSGQELCLQCHDAGRLLKDETHSYIEDTNCTECHNPHGGEDRFMFN